MPLQTGNTQQLKAGLIDGHPKVAWSRQEVSVAATVDLHKDTMNHDRIA